MGGGKGGGSVEYTPPPPSAAELELQQILLDEARNRTGNQSLRDQLMKEFLGSDPFTDKLDPATLSRLDEITGTYTKVRTDPLYEQADVAERNLRQRFASQGILDSSISADKQIDLEKELSKRISSVGEEASLFRYGAEEDLRKAILSNNLQKIGVIQSATDPTVAYNTLAALTGQRTAEANQALQIALANAQQGGGFDLLGALGIGAGTALGGMVAGPVGAAVGGNIGNQVGSSLSGSTRF